MEAVVAPLLHNMVPPAGIERIEFPQLFTTVTTGVAGIATGAALPDPAALVQPLPVCVTVYEPAILTVIEEVVSPVLHNKAPGAVVDKVEEPQLFTTVTKGVADEATGAATANPKTPAQPSTVLLAA
jgi:hypothetical protein